MPNNIIGIINIFLAALTPIGELRLAIPIGLTQYNFNPIIVYLIAVIGNIIPPILIMLFLPAISKFLREKSDYADRFFSWLFAHTRRKTEKYIKKYGALALIIFVAIPLPNTGAWTGSIAAWLFGIPFKKAIIYILYGILIAGLIVTALTLGVLKFPAFQ